MLHMGKTWFKGKQQHVSVQMPVSALAAGDLLLFAGCFAAIFGGVAVLVFATEGAVFLRRVLFVMGSFFLMFGLFLIRLLKKSGTKFKAAAVFPIIGGALLAASVAAALLLV
ncbi:MAG: hypothetical protein IJC61_02380 [Oscillospiraceae bacterium]|nr:hypothetical protein [Oscillospiraceae bacterium]